MAMIRDILTEDDNLTFDAGRVLWAIGVCVFLCLTSLTVWRGQPFDVQGFGIGFGAVLGAGGAMVKWTRKPSGG